MKKQKKEACFSIRMHGELLDFVHEEAEALGISTSGYIRMALIEKRNKEKEMAKLPLQSK
jgi:predicted DNA binding CopG/RHH family protein